MATRRAMPITATMTPPSATPLAVLVSGGLDSAILVGEEVMRRPFVVPIYVRFGLVWEEVERAYLERFLAALRAPGLRPLMVLQMPIGDVYGAHWSTTGQAVPDAASPDEAVFLPGRNALLLIKALLWCHLHGVPELALAPLHSNPFPDATPSFFAGFCGAVNQGVGGSVRVVLPYAGLHKEEVLRRGAQMPLQHTFSCIQPRHGLHCGRCNKCAERQKGFRAAGVVDPTFYAEY
ncbi:MAG: 7-cyano-7-deazaguanine synthase [Gemmataceae bacterium]